MTTQEQLTTLLAAKVMGWRVGPDRFLLGDRRWKPRWCFQPLERIVDALRLLEAAGPERYGISGSERCGFAVEVQINGVIGQASCSSQARAITLAVARASGIEVEL